MSENEALKGAGMIPWTEADSLEDISDANQQHLEQFIHASNQRIIDITNDDRAVNASLQESITSTEAVLETQSRNVTELRTQYETLRRENEYEATMRANLLKSNDETRANFDDMKSAINAANEALATSVAQREQLAAASAGAEVALREKRARLLRMESAFCEERRLMQQRLNDLAQRNKELAYIATHPAKFKEAERNEYTQRIENSAKELEKGRKYCAELEKLNKERQKSVSEIGRRIIVVSAELRAAQINNESKTKELVTTISNQEKILKEEDQEIESLKARIASQVNLAKVKTAEYECYDERLSVLKESRKNEEKILEEEEELMKNLEVRICNLKRKSNDNDVTIKKLSQDTEELVVKLAAMQQEVKKINEIKMSKELAEAEEEKKHRDEMATVLAQLKEAQREAHNKEILKKSIELKQIDLLKNVSKMENELTMLTENHSITYSLLIRENNLKSEELSFKLNMAKQLKDRKSAAAIELKNQEQINIKQNAENEKIKTQITEVLLKTEEKRVAQKKCLQNIMQGKEELQSKMEEVKTILSKNELMDTDLNKKLNAAALQQDALHKEIKRLRLEAQASVELLEERKQYNETKRTQLEDQLDNERKEHEIEMSKLSKTITEMELHLANEKNTFANLVSEIKKSTDLRSENKADTQKYRIELKQIQEEIRVEKENLLIATQEKENDIREKAQELQQAKHALEEINIEKDYLRGKLKYLSKRPNPTGASIGSNIKKKQ